MRAMQNFIGSSPWDNQSLLEEHQRRDEALFVQRSSGDTGGAVGVVECSPLAGGAVHRGLQKQTEDEPVCYVLLAGMVSSYDADDDSLSFPGEYPARAARGCVCPKGLPGSLVIASGPAQANL